MKLSDIKGERTLDVVADLIAPVMSIARDKAASGIFASEKTPEGMTSREFFIKRVEDNLPKLLKGHKQDFVSIMSTLKGVTAKEYVKNLNLATLLSDVYELMTDEEFGAFFT